MEPPDSRAKALFLQALELASTADRQALLERECGDDGALRVEVEGLLAAHGLPEAEEFLEQPLVALGRDHRRALASDNPRRPEASGSHSLRGFRAESLEESDTRGGLPVVNGKPLSTLAGRYAIKKKLDEGGMGEVYLAQDLRTNSRVVLKSPRPGMLLDDPGIRDRFLREVRAVGRLEHPHIVRVHDVFEEHGRPFAVFHYVSGDTLASRRPASLEDWLPLIADALDYLHSRNLVHRDVKPANIFFDAHGTPYLGDFGLVKPLEGALTDMQTMTGTGILLGTPKYMSPEAIESGPIDGRADQYALAIIAYEQLTGRTPFDAKTPAHLMTAHLSTPPYRLSDIDARYNEESSSVLDRALSKSPLKRFESCAAFASQLIQALPKSISPPEPAEESNSTRVPDTPPADSDASTFLEQEVVSYGWLGRYWHLSAVMLYGVSALQIFGPNDPILGIVICFFATQIALLAVPHRKRPNVRSRWHHHAVAAIGVAFCGTVLAFTVCLLAQLDPEYAASGVAVALIALCGRLLMGELGVTIALDGKQLRKPDGPRTWLLHAVRSLEWGSISVCATSWLYLVTHGDRGIWLSEATGWWVGDALVAGVLSGYVIVVLFFHDIGAAIVQRNRQ